MSPADDRHRLADRFKHGPLSAVEHDNVKQHSLRTPPQELGGTHSTSLSGGGYLLCRLIYPVPRGAGFEDCVAAWSANSGRRYLPSMPAAAQPAAR